MNSTIDTTSEKCKLCHSTVGNEEAVARCALCTKKGDLVGKVVWSIVQSAVRESTQTERVTFMLAGLSSSFLEGIARQTPNNGKSIEGRTIHLAFNPNAATDLEIHAPAISSTESAVHWRHSHVADVILFAPSDSEREGIGAGLGPVSRIDDRRIIEQIDSWTKILNETGDGEAYMTAMLHGLKLSEIYVDLDMWVEFVLAIKEQGFAVQAHHRIQQALPALRIPIGGLEKLPDYKVGGNPKAVPNSFRTAFQLARNNVGVYSGLLTPKQEPIDVEAARAAVQSYNHHNDPATQRALKAVKDLLDDESNIRPGEWRKSQRDFCELVPWDRVGSAIFASGRRSTKRGLGEKTLEFIEGNFKDDVSDDDRKLLEELGPSALKEPREEELAFFDKWQERLSHPDFIDLHRGWQKRLFSKEVLGQDLLTALSDGFEALIIAGSEIFSKMNKPHILIRASQHNKAMYWESLDIRTQELFRFELGLLQGAFSDRVFFELDACYKYNAKQNASRVSARQVELVMMLIDSSDIENGKVKNIPLAAPKVKVLWKPHQKKNQEPISLSMPSDFNSLSIAVKNSAPLFRKYEFSPRGESEGIESTTLQDARTFNDVAKSQDGRMFDTTIKPDSDTLTELKVLIRDFLNRRIITVDAADQLLQAVDDFHQKYSRAILQIVEEPRDVVHSNIVEEQANAFGDLCNAIRQFAVSEKAHKEIRTRVAEIGIICSDSSDKLAIVAPWHPFRLVEKQIKIRDFAGFLLNILNSSTAKNSDLAVTFDERRFLSSKWSFLEATYLFGETLISVEEVAGYSLMAPVGWGVKAQNALNISSRYAAAGFVEGLKRYLEVYPHRSAGLWLTIYNLNSNALPQELANEIMKMVHNDPNLICDLNVTHSNESELRKIYRNQNMRFTSDNLNQGSIKFCSNLRINLTTNSHFDSDEDTHDIDLVFLHESVSQYAFPEWKFEGTASSDLSPSFELAKLNRPRRKITELGDPSIGVYLTLQEPPSSLGHFYDLLYEMDKLAVLPEGKHAVLLRDVQFDNKDVKELISKAHAKSRWVVSCDRISSRKLLNSCGVQIIRDLSSAGKEERVIVSTKKIDERLKANINFDIVNTCGVKPDEALVLSEAVIRDVIKISGQKILSAAKLINASHEMIGLCVSKKLAEGLLNSSRLENMSPPIWISLDDYRGWFMSGKGKVADAICLSIKKNKFDYEIYLQIIEAKFVSTQSAFNEKDEAINQINATISRFNNILVENTDEITRSSWCRKLAELLINGEAIADALPDQAIRDDFLNKLSSGDVGFHISGDACISVHDRHDTSLDSGRDEVAKHIRHHMIPTPIILDLLRHSSRETLPMNHDIDEVNWHQVSIISEVKDLERVEGGIDEQFESENQPSDDAFLNSDSPELSDGAGDILEIPVDNDLEKHSKDIPESRLRADIDESQIAFEKSAFIPEPVFDILVDMASMESGAISDPESISWAERTCIETQRALSHFNMKATFVEPNFRLTPNGALITFQGHSTLTVSKVESRVNELLTTYGIEVADVRPGRGQISLFVKREKRAKVPLASSWLNSKWPDREPGELTNFIIGAREDEDGLLFLNVANSFGGYEEHGPHTLIAGETGSGKGILTQSLLLQIIAFNNPKNAELILIDPKKGVDFGWLSGAPQMSRPIITDIDRATEAFQELVKIMDERYEKLARLNAPNIAYYNKRVSPDERMSRIFLVHDELGAWMAQEKEYQETVLSAVANLGMKARAAGIHLILITQRADADAVPTRLRDNMGNRLCLKVQNGTGSRMVLSVQGAEKLLGKGHLACSLANQNPPPGQDFFVVQVPFAEPEDMERIAIAAKKFWS